MTHFPRVPLNMTYPDLYKSEPMSGAAFTNNQIQAFDVTDGKMGPEYRTPENRVNGNEVFRRLPNGSIDMDAAVSRVLNAVSNLKFGNPMNDMDCTILVACFPEAVGNRIPGADVAVAKASIRTKLRVSELEISDIAALTALKLVELHEWLVLAIRV